MAEHITITVDEDIITRLDERIAKLPPYGAKYSIAMALRSLLYGYWQKMPKGYTSSDEFTKAFRQTDITGNGYVDMAFHALINSQDSIFWDVVWGDGSGPMDVPPTEDRPPNNIVEELKYLRTELNLLRDKSSTIRNEVKHLRGLLSRIKSSAYR